MLAGFRVPPVVVPLPPGKTPAFVIPGIGTTPPPPPPSVTDPSGFTVEPTAVGIG